MERAQRHGLGRHAVCCWWRPALLPPAGTCADTGSGSGTYRHQRRCISFRLKHSSTILSLLQAPEACQKRAAADGAADTGRGYPCTCQCRTAAAAMPGAKSRTPTRPGRPQPASNSARLTVRGALGAEAGRFVRPGRCRGCVHSCRGGAQAGLAQVEPFGAVRGAESAVEPTCGVPGQQQGQEHHRNVREGGVVALHRIAVG